MKVLTYNVALLPTWVQLFATGEMPWSTNRRVRALAVALTRSDTDIVVLTELFNDGSFLYTDARAAIGSAFRNAGYHVHDIYGDSLLGFPQDSGLFVASRSPIVHTAGVIFAESADDDRHAHKAALALTIDVRESNGDQRMLLLVHAHLQSDPKFVGQFSRVRTTQVVEMKALLTQEVNRLRAAGRQPVVLITGDLNISAPGGVEVTHNESGWHEEPTPSDEYYALLSTFDQCVDCWSAVNADDNGYTWLGGTNTRIPADDRDRLRLDYQLNVRHCAEITLPSITVQHCVHFKPRLEGKDLSDHYGVLGTFSWPAPPKGDGPVDGGQWTVDGGQWTVDGGRRATQ